MSSVHCQFNCHAISVTRIIQLKEESVLLMRQILNVVFLNDFLFIRSRIFYNVLQFFFMQYFSFFSCLSVSGILFYQSTFNSIKLGAVPCFAFFMVSDF